MLAKSMARQLCNLENLMQPSSRMFSILRCQKSITHNNNNISNNSTRRSNHNQNHVSILSSHKNSRCNNSLIGVSSRSFVTGCSDEEVDCEGLESLLQNSDCAEKPYLIDVRTSKEIQDTGKIANALHIPVDEVEYALQLSDDVYEKFYGRERPCCDSEGEDVVFYCHAGIRSHRALTVAHSLGFQRSKHLRGGIVAWFEHKKPK